MAISGKTITIPEQSFSNYWVSELRILALDPNGSVSFRAILTPYRQDGDTLIKAINQDIVLNIPDFFAYAADHTDVASAMQAVLTAIEVAAKAQGLI